MGSVLGKMGSILAETGNILAGTCEGTGSALRGTGAVLWLPEWSRALDHSGSHKAQSHWNGCISVSVGSPRA